MAMDNLHTLVGTQGLGIECQGCWRRGHVSAHALGAREGDMTELRSLPLKCTKCQQRKVKMAILRTPGEIGLWLAGQNVGIDSPHQSMWVPYQPGTLRG